MKNRGFVFKWLLLCKGVLLQGLYAISPLQVDVSARGGILINAETGAVLWEKNAKELLYPASTTKMITALYAMEKKGEALDEWVVAPADAVVAVSPQVRRANYETHPPYRLEFGGTHMGIQTGEVLSFRTLLYGLMLSSANDAANVIAQHVSGNISQFMKELNQFVRKKGCKNTYLYTPHGLPHPDHKTTAYDMALLAREFLKNDFLREVACTGQYVRPQTNKHPQSVLSQYNALVKPGKFYYPKALGIKTGYTVDAGYCLVTAAVDGSRRLIVVLLGCEKLEQRYQDAIALFEKAFNEKKMVRPLFSKGFDLFSCQVEGGKSPLQAYLDQDLVLEYYPSEEPLFKTAVAWEKLSFPISPHQQVATLQVLSSEGILFAKAPLYALKGVEATWNHQVFLAWQKVKKGMWDHVALVMATLGIVILAGSCYVSLRSRKKK